MKKFISFFVVAAISFSAMTSIAQDKSKRPSPPAYVTATTSKGVTISINYSQPSVKGRTIGKEIATFGELWRTGANEATVFEVNKEVTIGGKKVKAGKYGLYSIPGAKEWTIILNNKSNLWGADNYSQSEDAVRLVTSAGKSKSFMEKMTFLISDAGKVSLVWGDTMVDFNVQ
jgi:hypothetical protein